jgi:hypothetical protein
MMPRALPGRAATGLTLLIVSAVAAPLYLPGGLSACLILSMLVCASWLFRLLLQRHVALDQSRIVAAVLLLMAVACLSFVVGQYPWFPAPHAPMRAQVGGLALFMLSGGLFLVVGHEVRSLGLLQRLTWTFVMLGGGLVVLQWLPDLPVSEAVDAVTRPESVGSAFWTWLVAMSCAQALHNGRLPPTAPAPLLQIGLQALTRGLVVSFSWVSGWLPPLVSLAVVLYLRFPRVVLGTTLLAVAPAMLLTESVGARLLSGESYSLTSRVEAWRIVLDMVQTNPWLGFGPANYYHYTTLFPIWGWWVRFNSHNNYLDLVAQTGIVGLLAFTWFAAEALRLGLKLRRRVPGGFSRAYVVGAIGGLAGMLVAGMLADWIIPFAYNIGLRGFRSSLLFWFFLGGLLALRRMLLAQTAAVEPREAAPDGLAIATA